MWNSTSKRYRNAAIVRIRGASYDEPSELESTTVDYDVIRMRDSEKPSSSLVANRRGCASFHSPPERDEKQREISGTNKPFVAKCDTHDAQKRDS